jgi:anaerobic selenocysteine-containing dehydrogenase
MGLTQHAHGVDNVRALMNVGLARGLPGRPNRGLMPIRGHSGVQGGAEVGCAPSFDAKTLDLWERVWGFPVPREAGHAAIGQIEASARGEIDVFWITGGNFLETVPDEERSRRALGNPALRVHQDIVVSSSMLVPPSDAMLLLPASTRYETPGGVTETSTERRIIFSPEIPGRRIGSARPEWEVFFDVVRRARPDRAAALAASDLSALRGEIAQAIPLYRGIETLQKQGDSAQWGGERLYADGHFATPDGKARFAVVRPPARSRRDGVFTVSTRRGKQFNSMVQRETDPLTGAAREDVLIAAEDAASLGVASGDPVRLVSDCGELRGHAFIAPIKPGNLEVHWPEGNALLGTQIDPDSGEPDYNARVRVEKA